MTTNNRSYEEQTRRLLADAKSELNSVEAQMADLLERSIELTREINAYEIALGAYLRRTGKEATAELDWTQLFEGKTHKEKLVEIAKHWGGRIRVSQAADLLYGKGFIKSKKRQNAYIIVQGLLADMTEQGIFEKVSPGEYRLIGAQQPLLNVS